MISKFYLFWEKAKPTVAINLITQTTARFLVKICSPFSEYTHIMYHIASWGHNDLVAIRNRAK